MNAHHFLLFRSVLLGILVLQTVYRPAASHAGPWLAVVLSGYAVASLVLFQRSRLGKLSQALASWTFLVDIAATTMVLGATHGASGDFYVAYFLVILSSCLSGKVGHSFIVGGVACLVYGALSLPSLDCAEATTFLLRLSLILATTFFAAAVVDGTRIVQESADDRYRERLTWLERLSMAGRIAASVLHELKTPLNTILLNAEAVRKDLGGREGPRESADRLRLIEDEVERASAILSDFLDFTGESEFLLAPVPLRRLVEETYRKLSPGIATDVIEFRDELAEGDAVRGSERHLAQVFLNILDNAILAMPFGGRLEVRGSRRQGMLEVSVRDTGVGIAADMLPRIFEPFATTRARKGGHGLGLFVVRWIVQKHGGDVVFRSEGPMRGAEVLVTLPLAAPES
ncbi:MAG: HAMP domain-containing histidine kinase [Elusimicrobia bacterium]|nr:HAMP domain-containing histidine kinase [Elusimicrobiota bacterium]